MARRGIFLDILEVRLRADQRWELVSVLRYRCKSGWTIIIPAGFVTDFASVPRLPIVFMLNGNVAHKAAVVHDYIYRTQIVARRRADAIFREAMAVSMPPEPFVRRWVMWLGVRLFGWVAWRKNRAAGLLRSTIDE